MQMQEEEGGGGPQWTLMLICTVLVYVGPTFLGCVCYVGHVCPAPTMLAYYTELGMLSAGMLYYMQPDMPGMPDLVDVDEPMPALVGSEDEADIAQQNGVGGGEGARLPTSQEGLGAGHMLQVSSSSSAITRLDGQIPSAISQ